MIVFSNKRFFMQVIREFDGQDPNPNFVDKTVDRILSRTLLNMPPELGAVGWNTDKPPYTHVQTIGHIAGLDQYVPGGSLSPDTEDLLSHRDPLLWGSISDTILGVSIHPKYGGWYAYRMLIVFTNVTWDGRVPRPEPLSFLSREEMESVIREYNSCPDMGRWRDYNDKRFKLQRYDVAQFLYFHERSSEKRRRILELLQPS